MILLMFSLSTDIPRITGFPVLKFSFHPTLETLVPGVPLVLILSSSVILALVDVRICMYFLLSSVHRASLNELFICSIIHCNTMYAFWHMQNTKAMLLYITGGGKFFVNTFFDAAYCTTVIMSNNHELYYMLCGLVFFRRVFLSLGICDGERWLLK